MDRGRDRRCRRPPRRSQRALLAQWAPPLGAGVESVVGPGMHDADTREPSDNEAVHALPVQAAALAAAPQRPVPAKGQLSKWRGVAVSQPWQGHDHQRDDDPTKASKDSPTED